MTKQVIGKAYVGVQVSRYAAEPPNSTSIFIPHPNFICQYG